MLIVADTHVHLYPCHDRAAWLRAAFANLTARDAHAKVVCLTERHDCHAFRENWLGAEPAGANALVAAEGAERVFVIAGRQVVTAERLEVLALCTDADIADGMAIGDVLKSVRDAGGVPVLAWAPGKWFFQRGKIIAEILEREAPGSLLIGDSSLRPTIWPDPDLMTYAHGKGFNIIAGSDPLPFAGEEARVGSYGIACNADFDEANPAGSIRRLLSNPQTPFLRIGRRGGPLDVLARLRKNAKSKRA